MFEDEKLCWAWRNFQFLKVFTGFVSFSHRLFSSTPKGFSDLDGVISGLSTQIFQLLVLLPHTKLLSAKAEWSDEFCMGKHLFPWCVVLKEHGGEGWPFRGRVLLHNGCLQRQIDCWLLVTFIIMVTSNSASIVRLSPGAAKHLIWCGQAWHCWILSAAAEVVLRKGSIRALPVLALHSSLAPIFHCANGLQPKRLTDVYYYSHEESLLRRIFAESPFWLLVGYGFRIVGFY